jgi:hypothetical protein
LVKKESKQNRSANLPARGIGEKLYSTQQSRGKDEEAADQRGSTHLNIQG